MRVAIFSDIHANREAFDACLAHAARQSIERYVFLGDLVGYGADPQYVVDRVVRFAKRARLCSRATTMRPPPPVPTTA